MKNLCVSECCFVSAGACCEPKYLGKKFVLACYENAASYKISCKYGFDPTIYQYDLKGQIGEGKWECQNNINSTVISCYCKILPCCSNL